MKPITKSNKLNNVCYDIRGPVLDEAARMEAQGIEILKLNIGNPAPFHMTAPNNIIENMTQNLRRAEGYSDSKGILSAREAIQGYCVRKQIPNVGLQDIYTGNGVSELIVSSMQALLDNGDEILIPSPDYPLWTAAVTLAGGNAVHYVCDESANWQPDLDDMRKKITPRTKGIVVINPNNPTGVLYSDDILAGIAEIARQHGLIIFADEIYDRIVMDGLSHKAMASFAPDLLVVNFNGLSKSHKIAGFRCGWMALSGEKSHAKGYIEGLNMLASMRLCSNVPAQYVIETALNATTEEPDPALLPGGRIYEQRETIYNAINAIPGLSATRPQAAFYIFPKIDAKRFNITDDERFVLDFLKEKHVLLVHGKGFHYNEPDHFRIVYLPEQKVLTDAMDRMQDFLSAYRQA